MRRRVKAPPAKPEPSPGMMTFYRHVVGVATAERICRTRMAGFDHLPRRLRMIANAFPVSIDALAKDYARLGEVATYKKYMDKFAGDVVKRQPKKGGK